MAVLPFFKIETIYRRDKKALLEMVNSEPIYQRLDEETAQVAGVLLGVEEEIMEKNKGDRTYNMCQALRELVEDGRLEGRLEGRKEGRKEGKIEGRDYIIVNMLKRGFSMEDICSLAECGPDVVEALRER